MQFFTVNFALLILAAFLLTVVGVWGWRWLAWRWQLLAVPNERSSHSQPTPFGGGIVMFFVIVGLFMVGAWQFDLLGEIAPFLLGAVVIAGTSWLDDLFNLSSLFRLLVHLSTALITVFSVGHFNHIELPLMPTWEVGVTGGQVLTVLWIVGMINAYNFIDGIDGIAGSQCLIAGAGWTALGFWFGHPLIITLGGLLAASSLGFLWHNWHPARVFMGDVGSAFLGYCFAILPLLAARNLGGETRWAVVGALLVWTTVFDSGLTFLLRAWRRENVLSAHRSHFFQRLVIVGYKHNSVTIGYGVLGLIGAVMTLAWMFGLKPLAIALAFIVPLLAAGLWWFVVRAEAGKFVRLLPPDDDDRLPNKTEFIVSGEN